MSGDEHLGPRPFRSGWCGRCAAAADGQPCVCECHRVTVPTVGQVLAEFDVAGLVEALAVVAALPGETPPAVRRLVSAGVELLEAEATG